MASRPQPLVPRGRPLEQSDAEETAAAVPTPAKITDAQRTWREDAPRALKSLLDATPTNGETP